MSELKTKCMCSKQQKGAQTHPQREHVSHTDATRPGAQAVRQPSSDERAQVRDLQREAGQMARAGLLGGRGQARDARRSLPLRRGRQQVQGDPRAGSKRCNHQRHHHHHHHHHYQVSQYRHIKLVS